MRAFELLLSAPQGIAGYSDLQGGCPLETKQALVHPLHARLGGQARITKLAADLPFTIDGARNGHRHHCVGKGEGRSAGRP
jgi:hypothetical protein